MSLMELYLMLTAHTHLPIHVSCGIALADNTTNPSTNSCLQWRCACRQWVILCFLVCLFNGAAPVSIDH